MYQKDVDDAAAYLMLHVPSSFLPSPYSVAAANERENNARNVEQKHSSQRSVMDRGVAAVLSRLQVAMLPVASSKGSKSMVSLPTSSSSSSRWRLTEL